MPDESLKPSDHILILEGPLRGGTGTVIAVEDEGRLIRAFVEKENQLTPPVDLRPDQIKKIHYGFWQMGWFDRTLIVLAGVAGIWLKATHSLTALAVFIACVIVAIGRICWFSYQARQLKSCPQCGGRLDRDTWSKCDGCGWRRPMPTFITDGHVSKT